jgi:hypothetical protein
MTLTLCLLGFFISGGAGTTALPILKTPVGPRPSAMGETFAALCDDATSLYWNPAGLGQSRTADYFLSHQEWFRDIRDEYACMALPVKGGRLGLGLTYSGVTGIESWNEFNRRDPEATTSNHTAVIATAYGAPVGERLHVGGGVKLLYDYLGQASSSGMGACLDAGVQVKPTPVLSLGASVENAGLASYLGDEGLFLLPTSLRVGAAYRWRDLNLVSDVVLPIDNGPSVHAGVEYTLLNTIALRAGYKTGPQDMSSLSYLSGLCVGMGLSLGRFSIDYAFAPYGNLGNTHRFGIRSSSGSHGFGRLKLVTVDARTGDPIPADVEVSGIREVSMTTRLDGRAYLDRMPQGKVKVHVSAPGYLPTVDSVYSWGDRDQAKTLGLRKPGHGTVWGAIYDRATGKPMLGFVAYRGPCSGDVRTDDQRMTYVIRDLVDGEYVLTAYDLYGQYTPQPCTLNLEPDLVITHDFTISLPQKQ